MMSHGIEWCTCEVFQPQQRGSGLSTGLTIDKISV